MSTQAGVAYVTIAYDPAAVQKLRETTRAEGQRMASSWNKVGNGLTRVGGTLTRSLTLPIVAAGAAATKYTYEFDQSMNHIQALVGANTKQMGYYRKSILALAPAVGQGPKELADALYFITSSGFKGAQALDVLKASAKGAAAGLGDTQTIADLVTSAINVYGQKNLTAARAVDDLTQAVKDGKGEPADYATALGRVIPVAQNLGVSFDQVSAALSALTLGGFSADKATTGLQSIFTNLSKPSTTAAKALHSVGLSAAGVRDEIKTKGLLPALLDLNKAFDGNAIKLRKVFTNGKAIVPFLSLTGQAAQKNVGIFNDLANSTGASEKAFKTQSQTTAFQIQQALAKIQVAAVQAGGVLLPIFASIATSVAGMLSKFSELPEGSQKFVVFGGVAVAALGPVLTVVGNLAKTLRGLKIGLIGAEGGFRGLLPLLVANPWVAVGAAVAVAAGYFLLTRDRTSEMGRAMNEAKTATDELGRALSGLKSANLDVRQAELDRANAADRLKESEHAVTKLIHEGKKGTEEYTRAVRDQKQAENDLGYAKLQLQQKQATQIAQSKKVAHANKDLLKSFSDIGKAAVDGAKGQANYNKALFNSFTPEEKAFKLHQINRLAIKKYAAGVADLASKNVELAAKFRSDSNPQMAAAKQKAGELALAAIDLAKRLGHIPTTHQINVYYKNNMQKLREEARLLAGEIANIPSTKTVSIQFAQAHGTPLVNTHAKGGIFAHAGGGVFTAPTRIGNDLFGEAGREAVVPLDSKYGQRMLADALAAAAPAPHVSVFVGNEPVDARVQVALKKTSRRLQAGQKWSLA